MEHFLALKEIIKSILPLHKNCQPCQNSCSVLWSNLLKYFLSSHPFSHNNTICDTSAKDFFRKFQYLISFSLFNAVTYTEYEIAAETLIFTEENPAETMSKNEHFTRLQLKETYKFAILLQLPLWVALQVWGYNLMNV